MVIKVSDKPVISIDTGKPLGTLKGLVYKNNKVTFLYCKFSDKYVYIPITATCIGSDAIMLKTTEEIHMFNTNAATKVYTENGEEVGTVTSIEIDDSFHITGITVDDLFIEIDKILHMQNVIIVKVDQTNIETHALASINCPVYSDVKDESTNQSENTKLVNDKLIIEEGLASIQQLNNPSIEDMEDMDPIDELNDSTTESTNTVVELSTPLTESVETVDYICEINPNDNEDELAIEVDQRYKYLCGKKLLEDITIVKETYLKDTLIDAPLIQFAINNNAIVKLIMNTED